ncbi:MAG: hypothetical protein GY757_02405 [bacterium]|nr:hypothetical protein [bacterium]
MKKILFFSVIIILLACATTFAAGVNELAGKTSAGILTFFESKKFVKTAVIKFENHTELSDLAAQKYYQLLVSTLETSGRLQYNDLMVNFHKGKGEFNLNRLEKLNYLIYIKLILNKNKLGTGVSIFSTTLDKLVYIKYFETPFDKGEQDIIETHNYGFKSAGFSQSIEIDASKNLLDFRSVTTPAGAVKYFFFYPGKIEIFNVENSHFKKTFSFKLEWGRPYHPVLEYEGRLTVFYRENDDRLFLTVGGNFSPKSKIFTLTGNTWKEIDTADFVPMKLIRLNNSDYLVGGRYDRGKNYFTEKLLLAPFPGGKIRNMELLEKKVPYFYDLDFSTLEGKWLEAVHLVDNSYNYRLYTGDLEEKVHSGEQEKCGAALAALGGQWLVVSAYTFKDDTLNFYKIEEGSRQLVYKNPIKGQVLFISPGLWKAKNGFWVYIKKTTLNNSEYKLQFWSKNNEAAQQ